jgi:disease resistance protein RPM1
MILHGYIIHIYYADREQGGRLEWSGRYKIVQGICSGLHYLHHELDNEQNIVHMDLRSSNVLVSCGEGGDITNVKIADFGLSRFFAAETQLYTKQVVGLRLV